MLQLVLWVLFMTWTSAAILRPLTDKYWGSLRVFKYSGNPSDCYDSCCRHSSGISEYFEIKNVDRLLIYQTLHYQSYNLDTDLSSSVISFHCRGQGCLLNCVILCYSSTWSYFTVPIFRVQFLFKKLLSFSGVGTVV